MITQLEKAIVALVFLAATPNAWSNLIDLNTFTPNPSSNVSIAVDGSLATLDEDIFGLTSLENWNFSVPADADSISFDYELVLPFDNEDYFDFYIGDLSAPEFTVGGAALSNDLIFSGTHVVDVSLWLGGGVPIIFDIQYGFGDFALDSYVTISNLNLTTVPEPGTMVLFVIALLALLTTHLRRNQYGNNT